MHKCILVQSCTRLLQCTVMHCNIQFCYEVNTVWIEWLVQAAHWTMHTSISVQSLTILHAAMNCNSRFCYEVNPVWIQWLVQAAHWTALLSAISPLMPCPLALLTVNMAYDDGDDEGSRFKHYH